MTLDLGTTSLSQARLARGLTLEDAEHGTRISRRFLIALEEHDYNAFPAPVYARGFLRTYCRYLGIDAEPQLAELPAAWAATTPTTHLPAVSRGPITLKLAWIVAGAVLGTIIGLGIFISRGNDNLGALEEQGQVLEEQQVQPSPDPAETPAASGQEQAPVAPTQPSVALGRSLEAGLPGLLPDFEGVAVSDVTGFLTQQGIPYLRIDAASDATAGLVIDQSPAPGTSTGGLGQVTLIVSAGSALGPARTNCAILESTNRRTAEEQAYFQTNCAAAAPLPDRTDCEEIRGTDYRSPAERVFFLANCVIQ